MNVALFCRKDSVYKKLPNWDVYDKERDATKYNKDYACVAHPPCRAWGVLAHLSNAPEGEKELALWALSKVREVGGILEHPSGSKLFKMLPPINGNTDEYSGFTIEIDQYDFGHVAHKATKLYIKGLSREQLPTLPPKDTTIHYCEKGKRRSICGNVKGTTRCTQYQREYTPIMLIKFFEETLKIIEENKTKCE